MYTHIVWDFNGTILDDVGISIESVNVLLKRRGLPTVDSVEMYHSVFGFPVVDYYERLGFDFEKESFDTVAVEWVTEYDARRKTAPIQKGALRLLDKFRENGIRQLVISATEQGMLHEQIENELNIGKYFDELMGLNNIKATSKAHLAVAWRERNRDAKVLFIGDTDHDMTVADSMGADCILVANGHQSFEQLLSLGADVCHSMDELYSRLFVD